MKKETAYANKENLFTTLSDFIKKRGIAIIIAFILLTIASLLLAGRIQFITQVKEFLPENNELVKNYNLIMDEFESAVNLVVTVEGPNKNTMIAAAEELSARVRAHEDLKGLTNSIQLTPNKEFLREWLLMMQESKDIKKTLRFFESPHLLTFLTQVNDNFEKTYIDESGEEEDELDTPREALEMAQFMGQVGTFTVTLREYLQDPELSSLSEDELLNRGRKLLELFLFGEGYTFDVNNSMLIFTILPNFEMEELEKVDRFMTAFQEVKEETEEFFPGVTVGYTGDLGQTYDEQRAISFDLMVPSLLAVVIIFLLFLFSFPRFRSILFALLSLVVGIILDLGIVGATIGELNMISSTFGVVLIGLGIDFGVHIISNFDDFRNRGMTGGSALKATFLGTGKAVIFGALTTAIAFYTLTFSDSRAITQFGFVAATGIITTLLAMLFLLPALLTTFNEKVPRKTTAPQRPMINYGFLSSLGKGAARFRIPVFIAVTVVTVFMALNIKNNEVEYNMTKLGPQESVSTITQQKVMEKFNISPYPSMVSYGSLEKTREITEVLQEERTAIQVSSITEVLYPLKEQRENLRVIREFQNRRGPFQDSAAVQDYSGNSYNDLLYEIQRLEWNMIEIGDIAVTALGEGNPVQKKRDMMIREVMGAEVGKPGKEVFQKLITLLEENRATYAAKINTLDRGFSRAVEETAGKALSVSRPMTLADIPKSIKTGMVSPGGNHFRITIVPLAEVNEKEELLKFKETMSSISPAITGTIQLSSELTEQIVEEIKRGSLYVAIAILIILLISFHSIKYTLIAMGSLGIAVVWMFGLFPIINTKINIVNVMVFPLIIGIGIAFFIHLIHRYRIEGDLGRALRYSGKGVILSGFTTMIGFGSLGLIATYAAAASLGRVFFVGVLSALLLSFVLLPGLLSLKRGIYRNNSHPPSRKERE